MIWIAGFNLPFWQIIMLHPIDHGGVYYVSFTFLKKITLFGRKGMCLDKLHKEVSYFSPLFIFVLNHLLNNFTITYLTDLQLIHIIQWFLYRYNVSPSGITLICSTMLPSLYYRCLALSRMINTKSSLFSRLAVVTSTITRH